MTLGFWDIDRLIKQAETPGQAAARKWLEKNPEKEMRAVQPGDLDRLTESHDYYDPRDEFFGVPAGGAIGSGAGSGGMNYPSEGYNRPERRYPSQPGDPGHQEPRHVTSPFEGHEDYDDDYEESEPEHYHIVTRPRDAIHGLNVFDEHPYAAFGNAYEYNPSSAMDMFAEDNPNYDTERFPTTAEHEIVGAHPAEHHDEWRRDLDEEENQFQRINQHGLQRESPEIPGHRAYRYEEPNGVVHRIWHNTYLSGGPAWQTSRYDPRLSREEQPTMWTAHSHSTFEDPLGEALGQFERNRQVR